MPDSPCADIRCGAEAKCVVKEGEASCQCKDGLAMNAATGRCLGEINACNLHS